jgi:hypothetical protein
MGRSSTHPALFSALVLGVTASCAHTGPGSVREAQSTEAPAPAPDHLKAPPAGPALPAGLGRLRLIVQPSEAEIRVDGVLQGRAADLGASAEFHLQPGTHRIEVSLVGYETYRAEVSLAADLTETIPIKLRPLPVAGEDGEKETKP